MTSPALTSEAIAFTEKKVDMALDDIIKMSKSKTTKSKKQRVPNKSHKLFDRKQNQSHKVRQYMDSRSSLRQGFLAQKRTSFQGSRFPVAAEAAKNAAVAPMKNKVFNRNRTANLNRPRASAAMNFQGNGPARVFANKPRFQQQRQQQQQLRQQQQQQQRQPQSQQQTMPKTLDSLFASMKEQRTQTFGHHNNVQNQRTGPVQQRQQWGGRGQRFRY